MSVHQLKDGRWICQYEKGKDRDRPESIRKYFGRGVGAEIKARAFDKMLHAKKSAPTSPTFMQLAEEFYSAKQQVLAATTKDRWMVRMRGTVLPDLGACLAHEITPGRLEKYAADRTSDGVKRTTIHREISDVRAILKWSIRRRLIAANPMEGYEMPSLDDACLSPPSEAEFGAILACAVPHMQRAMLISWFTGLRPGREELLSLRWESVDLLGKNLYVTSAVKGGMPRRMVPLGAQIMAHFEAWYKEDGGHGYLIHYGGDRVHSLQTAWENAKRRAGITRRIRLYDIRHAFATQLLAAGANLKAVSEIMGHASVDITMRIYQHVGDDLKRAAVDIFDSGIDFLPVTASKPSRSGHGRTPL